MPADQHSIRIRHSLSLMLAVSVMAGCNDMQSWWDTQFGPKQDAPQQTAQPAEQQQPPARRQQPTPQQTKPAPQQAPAQQPTQTSQQPRYAQNTPAQATTPQRSTTGAQPIQMQGSNGQPISSPPPAQSNYQVASSNSPQQTQQPDQLEDRIRRYVEEFPNSNNQTAGTTATPSNATTGYNSTTGGGTSSGGAEPMNNVGGQSSTETATSSNGVDGSSDVTWYEPVGQSGSARNNTPPATSTPMQSNTTPARKTNVTSPTQTASAPPQTTPTPQRSTQSYTPPNPSSGDNTPTFKDATMARPTGSSTQRPSPPPTRPDTAPPTRSASSDSMNSSSSSSTPAPPVLKQVSTSPPRQPEPTPVQTPPPARTSEVRTNETTRLDSARPASPSSSGGDSFDARIREMQQKVASNPNDVESQIELRMLYLASGDDAKAAEPIEGVSQEMSDMVAGLMSVLRKSRDAAGNPDAHADELLDSITKYRNQIATYADLRVPVVALCTEAKSYGSYDPYPPSRLIAGNDTPVIVYCEVENFSSQRSPDGPYRTRLSWQVEVLDGEGEIVATLGRKDFEDVSRNRRRDFFLADVLQIPGKLSAGDYVLRVMIEDRGSGRFSTGQMRFTMLPGVG